MTRTILTSMLVIAFTDVALQLDNALAISTVASGMPPAYRVAVLAGGVLLAGACLFAFTVIGSALIERINWLKPLAAAVLMVIGARLALDFFQS